MSQAVALFALLGASAAAEPGVAKELGVWAAEYLDAHVLVCFANVSAFTGFLLAAATPWGYFRRWWVAAKFAITIGQLHAGIFVLSKALRGPSATGVDAPVGAVALGAGGRTRLPDVALAVLVVALAVRTRRTVSSASSRS